MLKSIAKGISALVLGAMAVLAVPGQSRAAVFVGAFDPAFGSAFPNLGFRGQGTFFIPDPCLGFSGVVLLASCPGMTVTSAFVDFYDTRSEPGAPTLVSRTYVPPVQSLVSIYLDDGDLLGVRTNDLGPQFVTVPNTFSPFTPPIFSGNTWLQFDFFSGEGVLSGAYLFACSGVECSRNNAARSNLAVIDEFVRVVPEPGTVGLVLSALGIVGLVRRRRHQGKAISLVS